MSYSGMDTAAVRAVGNGLARQADAVVAAVAVVDHAVASLEPTWCGDDARRFADWWNQQHRPALAAAADALRHLATVAVRNADEQTAASGGATSGGAGVRDAGHGPSVAGVVGTGLHVGDTVIGTADKALLFAEQRFGHTSSFAHGLGVVGAGLGAVTSGWDAVESWRGGDHGDAVHSGVDAGASVLGAFGGTAELAAFDVKLWADVVDAGSKVDWTDWGPAGFPNPLDPEKLSDVWVPAMAETFGEVGSLIWGDL